MFQYTALRNNLHSYFVANLKAIGAYEMLYRIGNVPENVTCLTSLEYATSHEEKTFPLSSR